MSTKDDLKKIADSNNKEKNELQEKADKLLSNFYKEMYQLAGSGIYEMDISMPKDDWKIYKKAFDMLEEEKFLISPLGMPLDENDSADYRISWEK